MRPVLLLLAVLTFASATALAQTPPTPAVPAAPPARPVPPVALPEPQPMIDLGIDIDAVRRQAEAAAAAAGEQVQAQTEELREHLRELELDRHALERDFAYQLRRGEVPVIAARVGLLERGPYGGGLSALQRRQYEQAITRFDQVIGAGETHVDGALYWKAYAQYKLGQTNEALATIGTLREAHPQSRYLNDARVLEADARQSSGQPLTGDNDDDEIKLLAISGLQHSNPEGAVPLLDNVLKATNSLQVKKRALFVLAQNDDPAAHQLLVSYAKGAGNPDLQLEAIRYLVARRQQTSTAELHEIYNANTDRDVRLAVIAALSTAGDAEGLVGLARRETSNDLKVQIVRRLSSMAAHKNEAAAKYLMELIR